MTATCNFYGAAIPDSSLSWPTVENLANIPTCGTKKSYIRPDIGGAIQPWSYTAFWIVIHVLLFVTMRITRWEKAQILSLAAATYDVVRTVLAFTSTRLTPEKVMVWMPTDTSIHFGHLLVIIALMRKEHGPQLFFRKRYRGNMRSVPTSHYFIACYSLFLLLAFVTFQVVGLCYAIKGLSIKNFKVSYCSPVFDGYSLAVLSNCTAFTVVKDNKKGVNCVLLPANSQQFWIRATVILLPFAWVALLVDGYRLLLSSKSNLEGTRETTIRKPWFTAIFSILVLAIILGFGIYQASTIPTGVAKEVLVASTGPNRFEFICKGYLSMPGLRGMGIEWSDGLQSILGPIYWGS